VKFHLSNIYRKLNVANRTEASRWAQLHGILSDGPAQARTEVADATVSNGNGNGNGYHHSENGSNGRVLLGAAHR
jgi:hypothetical protein